MQYRKKYEDEKIENDSELHNNIGQPVMYGQAIHLKHLYSNCYLTYNPNQLATQYGCVALSLEEEGSEHSNFKFLASGNLKTREDVVQYSDLINLCSYRGMYFMHVFDEYNNSNSPETGLEVNGSESSSNWKLLRFMSHEEVEEFGKNN
mmetsp:Transcript_33989/g.30773  ORF Transcript_33989/g.30773 Transcript_33989/m.30773 type:complete len:149 (+) Transcript_33989:149-595(+)